MLTTTLQKESILERNDLQSAIIQSWEAFCSELGFEELFFIASEITPHDSCENRIDILALSRDGSPVVFELKRSRNRLHLLQALTYAAMISKWDSERYLSELSGSTGEQADELRSLLENDDFEIGIPEVVLVAESFDPEVILAADWLNGFGIPISAFSMTVTSHKGDTLISVDQKFPLLALDDVYEKRSRKKNIAGKPTLWKEVLGKVNYSFAERAVEIFSRLSAGTPSRKTFRALYHQSPLGRVGISFRRSYLKVYTRDQSDEKEKALTKLFGDTIPFSTWGNENTKNKGFTFILETEEQFSLFLKAVGETETL